MLKFHIHVYHFYIIGVIVQDKGISIYVHGTSTVVNAYAMCIITADFIKINCNSSKS